MAINKTYLCDRMYIHLNVSELHRGKPNIPDKNTNLQIGQDPSRAHFKMPVACTLNSFEKNPDVHSP